MPSQHMRRRPWPAILAISYVFLISYLGGLKAIHVILASLCLLDYYNESTRRFLKAFLPFILTGIMFDSMRYYYWQGVTGNIRVAEPYLIEKALFGIFDVTKGRIVTPNEFFEHRIFKSLDLACGFAYLFFIFEYFSCAFALYFLAKRIDIMRVFAWCFFCVNVMGFSTYFIYPAAPPWYITLYGFGPARLDVGPNAAATVRFDQILGTHFFTAMYGQGIDVYGSIPSLHVSYPFLVCWVALMLSRTASWPIKVFLLGSSVSFYLLMCFSAVYLQHHYVIDVVLGTIYAMIALLVVKWCINVLEKTAPTRTQII